MDVVHALREQLEEQTAVLERIGTEPLETASVVELNGKQAKIFTSNGPIVISDADLAVGDTILINRQTKQFVKKSVFSMTGASATVIDVSDQKAVIEIQGQKRLVPFISPVEAGDEVLLDEYSSVILEKLASSDGAYSVKETGVSWNDIGGNDEAKAALIEAIEHPRDHAELLAAYGAKPARGILLEGPPGCGKTMLGKAAATALGSVEGFFYVKGPELLSEFVGVAEGRVRGLFRKARAYHKATGHRAVIFLDEGESLLRVRGQKHMSNTDTVVTAFLAEMDGLEENTALVIIATNRAALLDPAIVRDGRCDRKIRVRRPTPTESFSILQLHLRDTPVQSDVADMALQTVQAMWRVGFENDGKPYELGQFASGALLAGIVAKAKSAAMRRDLEAGAVSGVSQGDLNEAIVLTTSELSYVPLGEM